MGNEFQLSMEAQEMFNQAVKKVAHEINERYPGFAAARIQLVATLLPILNTGHIELHTEVMAPPVKEEPKDPSATIGEMLRKAMEGGEPGELPGDPET